MPADAKLSALTAVTPAAADGLLLLDVSDTTGGAAGTARRCSVADLAAAVAALITDLTLTGAVRLVETTGVPTPAANSFTLAAEDDGAGKTRAFLLWPDGTRTVLGVQP
jgi:hypothetical protein